LLAPAAAAHPLDRFEPLDSVPYRVDYQGWITVNATVNGDGPNDFIVDSGATITSVFENLAARQSFAPAARGPIRILGLAGAERLPAYQLGEITVGKSRLQNHVGVILPDWQPPNTPPQGVLGLDLLTRYTVMLDASVNELKFYAPQSTLPERRTGGWTSTEMEPVYIAEQATPLHRIHVNVRGLDIPCLVDLGASGTIFNGPAFRAMSAGIRVNSWGLRGSAQNSRLNDVFDNTQQAVSVKITSLKIGKARWRNMTFLVYDAEIFREMGAGAKPYCLVGADLLRDRSFIFDFENEDFYVGPAP
jgi:predicted aspartyl protease